MVNLVRQLLAVVLQSEIDGGAPAVVLQQALLGRPRAVQLRCLRQLRARLRDRPALLQALPRFLRREPDVLRRQLHVIEEDCLPRRTPPEPVWLQDLLRWLLRHEAAAAWRTSRTARQTLSMVQHFLRSTGLLCCASLDDFLQRMRSLQPQQVVEGCRHFVETLCHTLASARRYQRIFQLLFLRVWPCSGVTAATLSADSALWKRQRRLTLAELDSLLSNNSRPAAHQAAGMTINRDHFEPHEVVQLIEANAARPRDAMILSMLLVAGLRRRGLLNVRLADVAEWSSAAGRLVAKDQGPPPYPIDS